MESQREMKGNKGNKDDGVMFVSVKFRNRNIKISHRGALLHKQNSGSLDFWLDSPILNINPIVAKNVTFFITKNTFLNNNIH